MNPLEVGSASRRVSKTSAAFFIDWAHERMNQIRLDDSSHRDEVIQYHRAAEQFWRLKVAEANADQAASRLACSNIPEMVSSAFPSSRLFTSMKVFFLPVVGEFVIGGIHADRFDGEDVPCH